MVVGLDHQRRLLDHYSSWGKVTGAGQKVNLSVYGATTGPVRHHRRRCSGWLLWWYATTTGAKPPQKVTFLNQPQARHDHTAGPRVHTCAMSVSDSTDLSAHLSRSVHRHHQRLRALCLHLRHRPLPLPLHLVLQPSDGGRHVPVLQRRTRRL